MLHDSGHKGARSGRGAGGVCFIKDIAAFAAYYEEKVRDPKGSVFLESAIEKNSELLKKSKKDLALLEGVYGARIRKK